MTSLEWPILAHLVLWQFHAPECTELYRFGGSSQLAALVETGDTKIPERTQLLAQVQCGPAAVTFLKPSGKRDRGKNFRFSIVIGGEIDKIAASLNG